MRDRDVADHRPRWQFAVVLLAAGALVLVLAMTVLPDDGCGSWVEQLNFLERSDLCHPNR